VVVAAVSWGTDTAARVGLCVQLQGQILQAQITNGNNSVTPSPHELLFITFMLRVHGIVQCCHLAGPP
jgi:hypothetical protein